jgi:hypothetical protein
MCNNHVIQPGFSDAVSIMVANVNIVWEIAAFDSKSPDILINDM